MSILGLKQRRLTAEWMDREDLPKNLHSEALRGLARINRASGTAASLWPPIQTLFERSGQRMLTLLDVGCGGADVPVALWKRALHHGLQLDVSGCDRSAMALEDAGRRAEAAGCPLRLLSADALDGNLPGAYDIVMTTLFLHHLADRQIAKLLADLHLCARRMVLVSDLRRSALGLVVAKLGTVLLSCSPVVRADGPASVRAALRVGELRRLAAEAGLGAATIRSVWPFRMLLIWRAL